MFEVEGSELLSVAEPGFGGRYLWGEREDFLERMKLFDEVMQGVEANVEALCSPAG